MLAKQVVWKKNASRQSTVVQRFTEVCDKYVDFLIASVVTGEKCTLLFLHLRTKLRAKIDS
ncbi:hypothetical protein NQ318_022011 [Aromia moschata]|uniref:Uncharacterized protein n=1 Tax=Aromia moschata TaxID=1265417 RepID=A0AAV8Z543_9CUCU|nr:hypothetical protein NQ318_022011 [Aromia moschata]